MGGKLIRRWISLTRGHLGSQILCACSGGLDSTALTQDQQLAIEFRPAADQISVPG